MGAIHDEVGKKGGPKGKLSGKKFGTLALRTMGICNFSVVL
jgi:hypothetical protein